MSCARILPLIFLQGQQLLVAGPGCGAKDAKDSNGKGKAKGPGTS